LLYVFIIILHFGVFVKKKDAFRRLLKIRYMKCWAVLLWHILTKGVDCVLLELGNES